MSSGDAHPICPICWQQSGREPCQATARCEFCDKSDSKSWKRFADARRKMLQRHDSIPATATRPPDAAESAVSQDEQPEEMEAEQAGSEPFSPLREVQLCDVYGADDQLPATQALERPLSTSQQADDRDSDTASVQMNLSGAPPTDRELSPSPNPEVRFYLYIEYCEI